MTNGKLDIQTIHGGCPVVVGSKWITVKWITWKHQEMKLPCLHEKQGDVRQPPLDNKMCLNNRCNMNNEVFYNPEIYYNHMMQFSDYTF